ncbi:hypothetical protein J7643_11945 [bacterium]|nr:hypothetical protein [bacterium]
MSSNKLILALLGGALLAGCVYVPLGKVPQLTAGTLAAAGKASLVLTPMIHEIGYVTRPEGFSTQAVLTPYVRADVKHVLFALYKVEDGTESAIIDPKGNPVTLDVPTEALDQSITFANLHPSATYRVRAFAFTAAGTASIDLISEEASSTLEIKVPDEEKPAAAEVPVTLKGKAFGAGGDASLSIIPGTYLTEIEAFR